MKKKLVSAAVSVCLCLCLTVGVAVPAFAAGDSTGPWDGDGTATLQQDGRWLLKGAAEPANMKPGPYVTFRDLIAGGDFSQGFESYVELDLSNIKAGDLVAWSFGVTGTETNAGSDYLDEAAFHFSCTEDGKAKLSMIESNVSGKAENNALTLETPVVAANNVFALKATFAPNEAGKLVITFYANGTKIGGWDTSHDYSKVKGPRYGWMFACYPTDGVLATVPQFSTLDKGSWVTEDGYGAAVKQADGSYKLFGSSIPANMKTGPFWRLSLGDTAITEGFTSTVKLDLSSMKAGDAVAWSFGVTGKETQNGSDYLDEAAFHFSCTEDGKAKLSMIESNVSGKAENNALTLETPVTATDNVFALSAKFTPNEAGKLVITFLANDTEIGSWATSHDYSAVKGPRYGWLFMCYPTDGVLVKDVPAVAAVKTEVPGETPTVTPIEDGKAEDEENGITVEAEAGVTLPEDVTLVVLPLDPDEDETVTDLVEKVPYDQADAAFDISLMKGDEVVKLEDGRVRVTIAFKTETGREYALYHVKDDGTYEKVDATFQDDKVVFLADSFSPFVILSKEASAPVNPTTGAAALPVFAVCATAAAFGVMMISKKKACSK